MTVALYARVSTPRQTHTQTIEQQLERLRTRVDKYISEQEHPQECLVFRDDGYSGTALRRPGLDALRDAVASAGIERVLMTAPDRLARKYVHQVLLLEELERFGCTVEFLDRPMSRDPHDQLLLQIRGAVAEYERTLIAERMRRGRLAKLRTGTLLPWTRVPYGYRVDPDRPRDPLGVRMDPVEGAVVQELFVRYLQPGATLQELVTALVQQGVPTTRQDTVEPINAALDVAQSGLSGTGLRQPYPCSPCAPAAFPDAAHWPAGHNARADGTRELAAGDDHPAAGLAGGV